MVIYNNDHLTATEVAYQTGYDKETVRRWCRGKKLPAVKWGQEWVIKASDLASFLDQRPKN